VYDLYTRVICFTENYYAFQKIEHLRDALLFSDKTINVIDLGAGSRKVNGNQRLIKEIAETSLATPKTGQLLFRLINEFQPKITFELGTSLGITTLYLATPCSANQVFTFEGSPEIMAVAEANLTFMGVGNVQTIAGDLSQTLYEQVKKVPTLDFVLFDANHRYEPTVNYFETCLPKAHEHSVFVFDDIYWSAEMQKAWQYIKNHPQVTLTIDLFQTGLVFFRKENFEKQHFKLRF
jgi:predicted O-methyltransferase YrrM